jgi:hypothetical protein
MRATNQPNLHPRHGWLRLLMGLGFAVAVICNLPTHAAAQVLYGSVVGALLDQSGAAVPGAHVRLSSPETGMIRETLSDAEGRYTIPNVLVGAYTLSVTAGSFRPVSRSDVNVVLNGVTRVDFKLEIGMVAETVTVSGSAAALQTDKSDVHADLNPEALANLPLSDYRNYQSLIDLTPGATPGEVQNAVNDTPQRSLTTNINGVFRNANNTRVDGVLNVFVSLPHHMAYVPPVEAIQTVNVTTASFDAEQGIAAGAGITVSTKSGTNAFRGVAFWYHDNQYLRARNVFLRTAGKPRSTSNFPGATFGGPIKRNKLFFFTSWEGTHMRTAQVANASVPAVPVRSGDFTGLNTIYDPTTGTATGTGRQPFAENIIPVSRQSAITRKILDMVPMPNRAIAGLTNFTNSGTQQLDRNNYDAKVNWNRVDTHTIWGKYSRMDARVHCDYSLGAIGGNGLCDSGVGTADTVVNLANFGHTLVIRPTLLLDGTFGFTKLDTFGKSTDYGTYYGRDVWGIPGTNGPDIRYSGLPLISTSYGYWGNPYLWLPLWRNDRSFTFTTNLSYIRRAHEFRFGYDLIRAHLNAWQPNVGNNGPRGLINFAGGETALNGGAATNYANSFASFLLGQMTNVGKAVQNYPMQTAREWQFGWYARDRWVVSRNFIVNLGLRHEYYPLMKRSDRGLERWDPQTNKVYLGGIGGNPDSVGIEVSKKLFAPRIGLAYRLSDKFVIRTGYGINIDPSSLARPRRSIYPSVVDASYAGPNSFTAYRPVELGIPQIPIPDTSSGVIDLPPAISMSNDSMWAGMFHRGYIQSWNFTIERRMPLAFLGTIAYVGTATTRSLADININASSPGRGQAGRPLAARLGRTVDTLMFDGCLSANYHSLQATANRQLRKGLMIRSSYTFSKAINMADEGQWGTVIWNWGPVFYRNRARAGYDRTHMFVSAVVYELPFGRGKSLATHGAADKMLRGWQMNGMFSSYTGLPFNVAASATSLNAPGNTQTADQVKPFVQKLGHTGPGEYFYDPDAFRPVTAARFGSTGRNLLTGPGRVNLNLSVFRTFAFNERTRLTFKAESFNFTNTPHFNNPSANVASAILNADGSLRSGNGFMNIISARTDERQVRFGFRLSF